SAGATGPCPNRSWKRAEIVEMSGFLGELADQTRAAGSCTGRKGGARLEMICSVWARPERTYRVLVVRDPDDLRIWEKARPDSRHARRRGCTASHHFRDRVLASSRGPSRSSQP